MKRDKVVFNFVASKPMEATDEDDLGPDTHVSPSRAFSSMLYKEAVKQGVLKSPVIRYY